jgi:hypothetical protein
MEAQAHASCNRRAGCCAQATAPPPAPLPRLLDCGTSTTTRGNPTHDPAAPAWRDGQCGQKWAGSNGGGRRAGAAVTSSARLTSHPGQRENPLSRREDDAPVFRSSNGSRTRNGRPANRTPRRINSAAGKAAPLAGGSERRFAFAIMTTSKKVRRVVQFRILFLFLFLSLTTGTRKGGYPEKDPSL